MLLPSRLLQKVRGLMRHTILYGCDLERKAHLLYDVTACTLLTLSTPGMGVPAAEHAAPSAPAKPAGGRSDSSASLQASKSRAMRESQIHVMPIGMAQSQRVAQPEPCATCGVLAVQ